MNQELQPADNLPAAGNANALAEIVPRSSQELLAQANIIREVLETVMLEGVHYDRVPGTKNMSLLKPGTEKIMSTFRLSADPQVEDLSGADDVRYRVTARLLSPSGVFLGSGVGECSSDEEKYRWRAQVCDDEWKEVKADDPFRARKKWKKGYRNEPPKRVFQVRTEPADLANTVLKMAKKRALADAVLTVTACSDIFEPVSEGGADAYAKGSAHANRDNYRNPAKQAPAAKANAEEFIDVAMLTTMLEGKAAEGKAVLNEYWSKLSNGERNAIGKDYWRIQKMCPPDEQ